jgi:hypothetical protein
MAPSRRPLFRRWSSFLAKCFAIQESLLDEVVAFTNIPLCATLGETILSELKCGQSRISYNGVPTDPLLLPAAPYRQEHLHADGREGIYGR